MGCPTARGDYARALVSGLSYVQLNKHGVTVAYHLHQRKDHAQHAILYAKVGKGGIKCKNTTSLSK